MGRPASHDADLTPCRFAPVHADDTHADGRMACFMWTTDARPSR
jgi:hypothetical protein